ncbi:hypothetical protein Pfo_012171 [Paulownia fortunei]|nr:hypothetical protein Pfo_012171 [Paulownia fortunei]
MSVFALLERLAPHIEREVNLILNSNQEAETLSSKLKKIQEGLQDAERQGVTDLNVKSWLKELEDVMYQMDDALDKWETENLELQIQPSEDEDVSDPWGKVRSLFLSLCLCFKHVVGRREITLEMKALSQRLDRILEQKGRYTFFSNKSDNSQEFKQEESTSFVDESKVYGRNSVRDSLVRMLIFKDVENGTRVISVVGVGGVGKTTLAQLAYNDLRVNKHFDLKAWVSVPDPFDASGIAKAILENVRNSSSGPSTLERLGQEDVGNSSSGASTLETLGQRIKAIVSKKSFLLVLDNVWTEDRTKWESLKNCLVGARGCRILVTTRSEIAARMMGTTHLQRLSLLSDADCGRILNRIALDGRSEEENEKYRVIGLEIAKKCNGLPLAARTIGSMLALRFTVQEWRDVLESPLWKYEDEISDLFRLLTLSYHDLSPILKRCFLSCVLYSKGSQLHADELIRIWMAQGYISSSATLDQVQLKGVQYFQKLSMRSFFQELERDKHGEGNVLCKMHDIMHDFANYLSTSEYYFILDGRTDQLSMPLDFMAMGRIRNFCVRFVSQGDLHPNLLSLLKCVRVLCLSHCRLQELSQEVGKLIHLRYLDLSGNPLSELPETVSDLYNLQTLDLVRCLYLSRLPRGIGKLMKLRHLLISDTKKLKQFPQGLEKLTGLWTLHRFRATRDTVGYLRNLNQLRGSLRVEFGSLNEAADAEKANLINKNHIKELELLFHEDVSMDVIEAMLPPPQLQTLDISGWRNRVPSWIATSLNNLKKLVIYGFDDCSDLPPLGKLPMLEKLYIGSMKFKSVTLEFLGIIPKGNAVGGFPKLKTLQFASCPRWEEWEDMEEAPEEDSVPLMPCLQVLTILRCRQLKALPHSLLRVATSLRHLGIAESDCLGSRYHQVFGADRDKISHIRHIRIWQSLSDSKRSPNMAKPK